ncbi:sodium:solute symporter [Dongshaea marina]|uniref:sodium:solute symporter n=1 Tax=Dongshaea marina TaxID=2047966 RepID=UPI000D3E054E|nr:sodium:solute symporter [Dongshaea marina]
MEHLNLIVISIYLLGVLGIGVFFAKRSGKNTDSFFKAGGRIPGWAAGFSIWATTLSSITFMAIPAMAYKGDWIFAVGNLSICLLAPFVFYYIVPFFRKLNVTSAYEYLEYRFDVRMRLLGSLSFMLFHIARIAIVIYLPTLAIVAVTGYNPYMIAVGIGILCVIYTFLGGIEGVIWSDVIQGMVLLGGIIISLVIGLYHIPGGIGETVKIAVEHNKLLNSSEIPWSFVKLTIPVMLIGSLFQNLYQYIGSQDVVQRYGTTSSMSDTKRSLYINAWLAFFSTLLFFSMGTVLYVYYFVHPQLHSTHLNSDSIFPYFIVNSLPNGVSGIIIAAIFAASQSTISSSLNSISACFTTDLMKRFHPEGSERHYVLLARVVIILVGLLGIGISLYMIATDQSGILMVFQSVLGLFGGPIAGAFLLGIFSKRGNAKGCLTGTLLSVIILYFVKMSSLTFLYYGMVGVCSSLILGYLFSLVFGSTKELEPELTIYNNS